MLERGEQDENTDEKKQDEILKLLAINEIIAAKGLKPKYLDCFGDNSINTIYAISGIKGIQKVRNILENWINKGEQK